MDVFIVLSGNIDELEEPWVICFKSLHKAKTEIELVTWQTYSTLLEDEPDLEAPEFIEWTRYADTWHGENGYDSFTIVKTTLV